MVRQPLHPAVVMKNAELRVNFGAQPFRFAPPGVRPLPPERQARHPAHTVWSAQASRVSQKRVRRSASRSVRAGRRVRVARGSSLALCAE
jgi:hypothetical protein